jgi:ribosomal protein S18 acetylase RimI-like enzyme
MESFHVRTAESADVGLVAQLNQHVQQIHVAAEPDDFRPIVPQLAEPFFSGLLARPVNVVLIAEGSDRPLGYVWAQDTQRGTNPLTKPVRSLYIHHIAVDPERRHMGIGRALVLGVEEEASKRHIDRIARLIIGPSTRKRRLFSHQWATKSSMSECVRHWDRGLSRRDPLGHCLGTRAEAEPSDFRSGSTNLGAPVRRDGVPPCGTMGYPVVPWTSGLMTVLDVVDGLGRRLVA